MVNKNNLVEQLKDLSIDDKISLISNINGYDGYFEDLRVYQNDEEFFEVFFNNKVMEAVRAVCYGEYYYSDHLVRFDAYGNLESLSKYRFEEEFDSQVEEIAKWIQENENNIDLEYYGIELEEINDEEKDGNKTLYQNLEEIQNTIEERKRDNNFDYYDNDNVCVIHVKFGRMKKGYCGLENTNDDYFVEEFKKFWADQESEFKTHWDVLRYVKDHNLPVIFYKNFTDEEVSFEDTIRYFLHENGTDNIPEYFINNYSYIINEFKNINEKTK